MSYQQKAMGQVRLLCDNRAEDDYVSAEPPFYQWAMSRPFHDQDAVDQVHEGAVLGGGDGTATIWQVCRRAD